MNTRGLAAAFLDFAIKNIPQLEVIVAACYQILIVQIEHQRCWNGLVFAAFIQAFVHKSRIDIPDYNDAIQTGGGDAFFTSAEGQGFD